MERDPFRSDSLFPIHHNGYIATQYHPDYEIPMDAILSQRKRKADGCIFGASCLTCIASECILPTNKCVRR